MTRDEQLSTICPNVVRFDSRLHESNRTDENLNERTRLTTTRNARTTRKRVQTKERKQFGVHEAESSIRRHSSALFVFTETTLHFVFAQTAAVQKRFAAAFAFLCFAAVETYVRLQRRLFTVTGSAKDADVRSQGLRLVKHRQWIKVAIVITMLAQKPRVRERLVAIFAHVLPFRQFGVRILFQAS